MKKLVAMLMICALFISNTVVFAADAPSLEFLKQSASIGDMEQSGTLSFKLNKPFGLLEIIAEDEDSDIMSNYVDIVALVESLFDTTMAVSSKTKTTNGGKTRSSETHIKSNIAFKANDNLEGDIRTNYSVWAEVDFSDEENPYFDVIMTHPFVAKYITVDSKLIAENGGVSNEDLLEVYKAVSDGQNLAKFNAEAVDSMKRNASVMGTSKKVKIAFTDIGLKMYLMDVLVSVLSEIDESILGEFDSDVVKEALAQVPVFGNEALVIEYTLDSKGRIIEDKSVLNVNLNIYDLMLALGEDEPPEETGITREKCQLDFTVTAHASYKYGVVEIKKPVLTEKNSIDIFEYEDPYYYDDYYSDEYYEEDLYWVYSSIYADIDKNCIVDNEIKYVCLRNFMEELGYSVFYNDGKIFGETENPYATYKALLFTVGADTASTDVQDVELEVPIFVIDGVSYISLNDCKRLTGYIDGEWSSYNFYSGYGYTEFVTNEYYNDYYGE